MKLAVTGNQFIALPEENVNYREWTAAKLQNNESLIDPLNGFDINRILADKEAILNIESLDALHEINEKVLKMVNACTTREELEALWSDLSFSQETKRTVDGETIGVNIIGNKLITVVLTNDQYQLKDGDEGYAGESVNTLYENWRKSSGYVKAS